MSLSLFRALVAVVAVVSFAGAEVLACSSSDSSGTPGCPNLSTTCPSMTPSFATDVEPLVGTYCLRCHGEGGIEEAQFNYTSYKGIYENRAEMLTQLNQCQMPPSDASPPAVMPTTDERQTLLSWLVCGAPNN